MLNITDILNMDIHTILVHNISQVYWFTELCYQNLFMTVIISAPHYIRSSMTDEFFEQYKTFF